MIDPHLSNQLHEVQTLCLKYNVSKLYAFGSIVDGRFVYGKSDMDFLIEFHQNDLTKKEIAKSLLLLWLEFQKIFQTKVDLISNAHLKGKYFKKYLDIYKVKIFDIDEFRS